MKTSYWIPLCLVGAFVFVASTVAPHAADLINTASAKGLDPDGDIIVSHSDTVVLELDRLRKGNGVRVIPGMSASCEAATADITQGMETDSQTLICSSPTQ